MIGWVIVIIFLVLVGIVLLRAMILKPTPARDLKLEPEKSERSIKYGKQLAKMIQVETISSRFDSDRSKFYKFHHVLEELFPNVHRVCEKHDFNGSLLFQWKGTGKYEPILFMSHQDVVEATGIWEHEPFSGDIDENGNVRFVESYNADKTLANVLSVDILTADVPAEMAAVPSDFTQYSGMSGLLQFASGLMPQNTSE